VVDIGSADLKPHRIGSLDWQFSNVTRDSTYQFVGPWSELDEDLVEAKKVFEMRGKTRTPKIMYIH
jgi:hypothetical protein